MIDRIETDRLILRRITPADAQDIALFLSNVSVACWLTRVPFPYGPKHAAEFTARVENERLAHFAITYEGKFVGCISSQDHLGYWLGEPFWGRGFATEAGQAIVQHRFANDQSDLLSGYLAGNEVSRNVLTKLGFHETGVGQVFVPTLGRQADLHNMALSHDQWAALQ